MEGTSSNGNQGSQSGAPQQPASAQSASPQSQKAVCVSLHPGQKPCKVYGENPSEFREVVQSSTITWINFAVTDLEKEGAETAAKLGFSDTLVPALLKGFYSNYEDRDVELGLMVPAVRIHGLEIKTYNLIILIRKNLILTMHDEAITRFIQFSRYADTFLRKLPDSMAPEDKLTNMLVRILDENNNRNFEQLREIQDQGDKMSEVLSDPKAPRERIGRSIYEMKHALIEYLNSMWRTNDVLNSLRYGDADIITDNAKILTKIGLLIEDVNRQISLAEHMSDVLASGLEVLQTIYNNQLQTLNNRMTLAVAWLTILGTALLVPNTIATYFGSIAGLDPKTFLWYTIVIVLATVNATVLAWWWVGSKVIMPRTASDTDVLREERPSIK
ncbi:MAG TPA: CorA family divalent cation transporter [Methanomassiliicoccales archaeon]|nr:CorA family divalent cation transporter [Methanomassiliicoccales archaeon]